MILFLDFDGVLHPFDCPDGMFTLLSDFERVMRDFPEVDIVISSSWREAHALDELRGLFSPDIARRIIDATPIMRDFTHECVRELEILAWLREVGREKEPWVAIDDFEKFFSPGCENLVLTDTNIGFDERVERELRKRLG